MSQGRWSAGDPAPRFSSITPGEAGFQFDAAAGRYLVLCFFQSTALEKSRAALAHMVARPGFFDDQTASFFGVSTDPRDASDARLTQRPGIRYLWDLKGELSKLYGAMPEGEAGKVQYDPFTLLIDPMLRVIASIPLDNIEQHNRTFDALVAKLPPVDQHGGAATPAPVLILPRVFEADLCHTLIGLFEKDGGFESGFMQEIDGKTVRIQDNRFKRRRDFDFDRKPEFETLRAAIRERIGRRIIPELHHAFQFRATCMERYIVSRYDGETGGFFRPHRDNTTVGTAHRRFACTINLNAEDYSGGDLRFPEFGRQTYRAPTGGAAIFSCSLLHEATPVTHGNRYAFLPFFYDDNDAALQRKNLQALSDRTINRNKDEAFLQGDHAGADSGM